jgi:hypothetical protein
MLHVQHRPDAAAPDRAPPERRGVRLREPVQVLRDPEPEFQDPRVGHRRADRGAKAVGTRDDQRGEVQEENIRPRRHLKQSDGGRQRAPT